MIDNQVLLSFTNECVRTVGDRLAGLIPIPGAVIDSFVGKGLAAVLGTTDAKILRAEPWTDQDYADVPVSEIADSGSGGRVTLTNHHVIGIIRALVALKAMTDANPALGPLVGAVAVNPRV